MNYLDDIVSKRIDSYTSEMYISKQLTVKLFFSVLGYYFIVLSIFFPIISSLPLIKILFVIFHTVTTFVLFAIKPVSNYNKRVYECILIELTKILSENIYKPIFVPYEKRQVKKGVIFNKSEFENLIKMKQEE